MNIFLYALALLFALRALRDALTVWCQAPPRRPKAEDVATGALLALVCVAVAAGWLP